MNVTTLRICDANCNRAREAMRVIEDYARFVLNHGELCQTLKAMRHRFQGITAPLQAQAIAARDTAGDVGTGLTTESERTRESLGSVLTAACKRLAEALRTIEEYTKLTDPAAAAQIEQLRYQGYDIERAILLTLSPGRERMRGVVLYVLVTESLCRANWLATTEAALLGGADCVQLREKNLEGAELLRRARALVALCRRYNALCIINDRPDIALLSDADGVHVGQGDLPARETRQMLGPDKIVGVSTHAIEQARQAVLDGADYVGVGPIFPSTTKVKSTLAGLSYAEAAAKELPIPAVAISGISASNASLLRRAGVRAAAVSSAVIGADDPQAAARMLKQALMSDPAA
ncbi:MAG: thiamine phosphate synthase [Tepidisphaeraceae bacterium]